MEKDINRLVANIIDQAKHFLTKAGEYYPFGSVIKSDGSLVPLGVYLENDHPDSSEVLQILQETIKLRLTKKETIVAAIGLDVLYQPAGESVKKDALKIMVLTNEGTSLDYYLPYINVGGEFSFEKVFSESGTLKLD